MESQRLLILGSVVHILFLIAIIDIYFKSPIVKNVAPVKNDVGAFADRAVFFSVDGLRFDSLFDKDPDSGEDVAPYIQKIVRERGSWGMSQTRVPTESRPGHVAMFAGFYEDPFAVTKGWKENPVDFDSIVNQSVCSFSWASPSTINYFYKRLNHDCFYKETYGPEVDYDQEESTTEYDNWVYDKLKLFFQNPENRLFLQKRSSFFFLHLLGQDLSGHFNEPHTFKYRRNLRNVDRLVKEIEILFNNFYKDNRTSFILSSDHGMSDSGSHGGGLRSQIETPFVAWGAGIKRSSSGTNISQVDIAPLLAVLLGVSIPVNSVGVLPTSYLNTSQKNVAKALFLNSKQLSAQFRTKEQSFVMLLSPFVKLSDGKLDLMIKLISVHIDYGQIGEALEKSRILIDLCLEGLDYYHNYHQKTLLTSLILSYLGWILYLVSELFSNDKFIFRKKSFLTLAFTSSVVLTVILVYIQRFPFLHYFYYLLPQFLWFLVFHKIKTLRFIFKKIKRVRYLIFILVVIGGVELLVVGYFVRWVVSISFGIILVWSSSFLSKWNLIFTALWISSGIVLLIFPFVPIIRNQPNLFLNFFSGALLFLVSLCYLRKENFFLSAARFILIATSVWNSAFIRIHFNIDDELPWLNQSLSWFLFFLSLVSLSFGSGNIMERLQQISMGLSVPYFLLSINHECFFLLSLYVNLLCWFRIEAFTESDNLLNSSVGVSDFRRAYFLLSYFSIAFFGMDNIIDLSRFDPNWFRCFLTQPDSCSPFRYPLLIFKFLVPILAVVCTARALNDFLDIKPNRLAMILCIYWNIMGLNLLFCVTNEGSWLDIGVSITKYAIQQSAIGFFILFYAVAKCLISVSFFHSNINVPKNTELYLNLKAHKS